jgi:ABC-2 type transport system permease protein
MNPILANGCNEIQKLTVKRVTKLFLLLALVLPFVIKLLVHKLIITDWMALPADNINYSILDLFVIILLPLFCFIAATDLFTSEAEKGTLFPIRPISRMELFLSKTSAIGVFNIILLLIVWASVMISSLIFDTTFYLSSIAGSLGAFLVSWFPLMVMIAFAVMLSLMLNRSIVAISSMIFLYMVMFFLPYVFPNLLYMVPSSYLDWYMQWLGDVSFFWIIQTFTFLISSFVLFLTIGYYMFNKKEA